MTKKHKIRRMEGVSIKKIIFRHSLLIGLAYSFLMFLLVYIFAYPSWETADDFLISGILSGVTGESSPYVLVISYPLSYMLYLMQIWFPQLNWLTLLEIFAVWISFAIYIWIFLKKQTGVGYLTALIMPLVFEIPFYMSLNYTRSACILAFAGLFLLYHCSFERPSKIGCVSGVVLLVLGSLIRYACIFLAVPYVGIWVVICLWKQIKGRDFKRKENTKFMLFVISAFIIIFGLNFYHKYEYNKFDLQSDYVQFNSIRAKAYDYLPENYQIYQDEFEKIGVSQNDYEMLRGSIIYDNFYNIDLYSDIAEINNNENKTFSQKWEIVNARLWENFAYYNSGSLSGKNNIYILFMIVACLSLIFISKKTIFSYMCTLFGTLIICFYFIWTGRFPPWVQDSLYLIACITFLYGIELKPTWNHKGSKNRWIRIGKQTLLYLGCMGLIFMGLCFSREKILEKAVVKPIPELCLALNYMQSDKDNIYLIDNFSYCPYPIMDAYGNLWGLERGSWSNIIRVGTWFINHPVLNEQLEEVGLHSPIREMVNDNIYLFTDLNSINLRKYQIFIYEHYGLSVWPELIEQWGNYAIYSFQIIG